MILWLMAGCLFIGGAEHAERMGAAGAATPDSGAADADTDADIAGSYAGDITITTAGTLEFADTCEGTATLTIHPDDSLTGSWACTGERTSLTGTLDGIVNSTQAAGDYEMDDDLEDDGPWEGDIIRGSPNRVTGRFSGSTMSGLSNVTYSANFSASQQ